MHSNGGTSHLWAEQGYPRPQLCHDGWVSLNGVWEFQADPEDLGLDQRWYLPNGLRGAEDAALQSGTALFGTTINVPFPPGSELSTVFTDAPQDVPDVVWYRRQISPEELAAAGFNRSRSDGPDPNGADGSGGPCDPNGQVFLNFEAVDYQADAWVDGQHCAHHVGGYTPFSVPLATAPTAPAVPLATDPAAPKPS